MNWVRFGFAIVLAWPALAARDVAFDLNERGLAATKRGDYAEAQRLYTEALERWKGLGTEFEVHLAITKMNLAQVYCAQGRRTEGVQSLEESLAVLRRTLGIEAETTLTTLNLLAGSYLMTGNFSKVEPLLQEAIPIERVKFPRDIQLARSLGALAALRTHDGNLAEALPLAEEALAIAVNSEPEESVDVALAYANVAEIHRVSDRPERSLPLYRKARSIYERLLGQQHPRVASMLSQEGLIYMREGKLALAEQAMERALSIVAQHCPDCMAERWIGECNLGLLRFKQGRYVQAGELLAHSLDLQEQFVAQPNADMAATMQALALVRTKERRFQDAERLNRRAGLILSFH